MNEFDGSGRMRARRPRSQGLDDPPCRSSARTRSPTSALPAEYRGAPMAGGKDRAPHARRRGLAAVLLTALLSLAAQTGHWRQVARMAYGVARALGVEVGSSLSGRDRQFGHVCGAAWSTLTRHLSAPHALVAPLSALGHAGHLHHPGWAGPGRPIARSFNPPPSGRGLGGGLPTWGSVADNTPFGGDPSPGLD